MGIWISERKIAERSRVRQYWQRYKESVEEYCLDLRWEWFVTVTFKPELKEPHRGTHSLAFCKRHWTLLLKRLSLQAYGLRWHEKRRGVWGVESWERTRAGRWHVHALVSGIRHLDAPQPSSMGKTAAGRFVVMDYTYDHPVLGMSRIYDVTRKRIEYVVKYVCKGPQHWDCFGHWPSQHLCRKSRA